MHCLSYMVRNVMLNLSFLMMKIKMVMTYQNLKRKTKVSFIEIFSQEIYISQGGAHKIFLGKNITLKITHT